MRKWTSALGLVALIALAVGLSGVLANDGVNVSVTVQPNGADDAGCLIGAVSIPVGDFGAIIADGDTWRGSNDVVLSIPLSQDRVPEAIDCRIEIVGSDLAVAGTAEGIPSAHLAITGCNVDAPVSLAVPRGMTCSADRHTTHVEVTVSLIGLTQQPTGALSGTIVLSGINGS